MIITSIVSDTTIEFNGSLELAEQIALYLHNHETALLIKAGDMALLEFIFTSYEDLAAHADKVSDDGYCFLVQ